MEEKNDSNGANLGFERKLWTAADKLRNNTALMSILKLRLIGSGSYSAGGCRARD